MLSVIHSALLRGVQAEPMRIEVDVATGLPGFSLVGLPDGALRESRERVFASLKHGGFQIPSRKITINLAPADWKKEGSGYDLPIAMGLIAASGQGQWSGLEYVAVTGELGLDGQVRPVRGLLPMALAASRLGMRAIMVPQMQVEEIRSVSGLQIWGVSTLAEAVASMQWACSLQQTKQPQSIEAYPLARTQNTALDIADIRGHDFAKFALLVSAIGRHSFLLEGPPGCGKSMLAQALPGILPPLPKEEAVEVACIYSSLGKPVHDFLNHGLRPFRSPHHSISPEALLGGGKWARPGELSLAHGGILFLDELPEFKRHTLEALRQPLEEGQVRISRAEQQIHYPCKCLFVAAMNPCPCGYAGDAFMACTCMPEEVHRYRNRISGPLRDRIDMRITLLAPDFQKAFTSRFREESQVILAKENFESSTESLWKPFIQGGTERMKEHVKSATLRLQNRGTSMGMTLSPGLFPDLSRIPLDTLEKELSLSDACWKVLRAHHAEEGFSMRGHGKMLRLLFTLCALADISSPTPAMVNLALWLRYGASTKQSRHGSPSQVSISRVTA